MLVHDDYSGATFFTESEQYQKPILSPEEIKQLRKEYKDFWFYFHLMQWGSYWNSIMLDPPREQTTIPMDDLPEWMEEQRMHIEQTKEYLDRLKGNSNDDNQ